MFFLGYKITQFLSKILRLCNLFAVLWLFYEFWGGIALRRGKDISTAGIPDAQGNACPLRQVVKNTLEKCNRII